MAYKVRDLVKDSLFEIGAYGPGDPDPDAADAELGLARLNMELDAWAARKVFVYADTFSLFTLTPNHQPHLIGPGLTVPDFAAAQRPVRLEGAALVLNNVNPPVDSPIIRIRDAAWWQGQRVKSIATSTPTDVYYEADWPNGALYFWPIPTFPYQVRLQLWTLISQFASINDPFSLPPAYKKALMLTLAERLCRPFGRPLSPDLMNDAKKARADLQTNNAKSPRIASADYGTQGGSPARGSFNYYTGLPAD